jgi:hypothetical protein
VGVGATVRDFWSFALSDLQSNVTRGVLAEFLVARAVGAEESVRASWDNYDVTAPDGTRIEVKSAAYLQSWRQRTHSQIRFNGLSGLRWDDEAGWGEEREVRADVFVFGVQICRTHADFDPLDVGQWEWYVAPARRVAENGSRSVGLGFLEATPPARSPMRRLPMPSSARGARPPPIQTPSPSRVTKPYRRPGPLALHKNEPGYAPVRRCATAGTPPREAVGRVRRRSARGAWRRRPRR